MQVHRNQLVILVACTLAAASHAQADEVEFDNGVQLQWSAGISVGTAWRTRSADKALYSRPYGGTGNAGNQLGDLNFRDKGDIYSTPINFDGELKLVQDRRGLVLGGRAWYDQTLESNKVPVGSPANGFNPDSRLVDSGMYSLARFSGIELGNAYVFDTFEPLADKPLNVRLGNHVVNWGESLFIPGVNQFGAFNLVASHQPGTTVKDIMLPIPQISANWGLGDGLSMEAFYQLSGSKSVADGCGTFWSPSDTYNCGKPGPALGDSVGNLYTQAHGSAATANLNFVAGSMPDRGPKKSGQFGLSAHYYASDISTDFGAYYASYNQRLPVLSLSNVGSSDTSSVYSGLYTGNAAYGALAAFRAMSGYWDYSASNIKTLGLSASTEVGGWAVAGEASYTRGIPVQINAVDMVLGLQFGIGPLASLRSLPANSTINGYDLHNKLQVQLNTSHVFPQVAGADSLTLVGEVAAQRWSGMTDPNDSSAIRYGRAFVYGFATNNATLCARFNANADYCQADGFYTTNAWGYRLQAELNYPNAIAGWNLKPRVFWADDVHGYSADSIFVQNRRSLGLSLRGDYLNKYYAQIAYTTFNHHAMYDAMHDRDNITAVVGIKF